MMQNMVFIPCSNAEDTWSSRADRNICWKEYPQRKSDDEK